MIQPENFDVEEKYDGKGKRMKKTCSQVDEPKIWEFQLEEFAVACVFLVRFTQVFRNNMQAGWCHQAAKQLLKPGVSACFPGQRQAGNCAK